MSDLNLTGRLFSKAVNPLNINDRQTYLASFHRPVPSHLGLAINLTWKDGNPKAEKEGQTAMTALSAAAIQLLESAPFRQQYLSPIGVHYFQVQCIGSSSLEELWNQCPNVAAKWVVNDMAIMVAFYDPDVSGPAYAGKAYGAAMLVLQECISESRSVDPTTHSPLNLKRTMAREHDEAIGSLYEDGVGLWCKPLVPLWGILMDRFHAYLKSIPSGGLLALIDPATPLP